MSMKVKTRQVDGVTIMDLSGRITLGEGSVTIRDAVRDVLAKGSNKILLNLGDINYIDSSGIGEIVRAHTLARKSSGQMKIADPSPMVHEMLHMTMLNKLIEIYPSETAAAESFTGSAAKA